MEYRARHAWLVPLACALLPAVAVHAAWLLSVAEGHIPDCIPHVEGCTSISRAARHGTANGVFKALMLPAAALQAWYWSIAARSFAGGESHLGRGLRPLGLVAAVALAVYALFLGTEGSVYGWLRRYGITFYFAGTFLAMVVYLRARLATGRERALALTMVGVCLLMLALGIANTVAQVAIDRPHAERLRDAMEWQLGALVTLWFALDAWCWRRRME